MAAVGTTNRENVLLDIATALALINGSGLYDLALATPPEWEFKNFDEVGPENKPFVCFFPDLNSPPPTHFPFGGERDQLNIKIVGHVIGTTPQIRSGNLSSLEEDIKRAMETDPTRGGWAVDTIKITLPQTSEGNPDTGGVNKNTGSLEMGYQITYYPDD